MNGCRHSAILAVWDLTVGEPVANITFTVLYGNMLKLCLNKLREPFNYRLLNSRVKVYIPCIGHSIKLDLTLSGCDGTQWTLSEAQQRILQHPGDFFLPLLVQVLHPSWLPESLGLEFRFF